VETDDEELTRALSVRQVVALAGVLGISPSALLEEPPVLPPLAPAGLVEALRLQNPTPEEIAAFEEQAGWDIRETLDRPELFWGWNIDELQEVCATAGIEWRRVIAAFDDRVGA